MRGHPRPKPTGIPSPGSAPLGASINAVLSMHPTPRPIPISSQFLLFLHMPSVLKMYWVVLTADCRNSVCRNRVCWNSVCLPFYRFHRWQIVYTVSITNWTNWTLWQNRFIRFTHAGGPNVCSLYCCVKFIYYSPLFTSVVSGSNEVSSFPRTFEHQHRNVRLNRFISGK